MKICFSNNEAIVIAAKYMKENGWYVRHKQWKYAHRQLDLVCINPDMSLIVFIEVSNDGHFVSSSLDDIATTAAIYVRDYHIENIPIRFDTINVRASSNNSYQIEHTENTQKGIDPYTFYELMYERLHIQNMFHDK